MISVAPIVSVVIACYNDGVFLREAIASAEANRAGQHEVIIVSDGTTDPVTLQVLSEAETHGHRVLRQENRGPAAARNTGIRAARGRYVLPLDADNHLRSAYLDRGIAVLDACPDLDVVYGDPEDFGERQGRRRIGDFDLRRLLVFNYIDTCAMFRLTTWERVGGYDEQMPRYGMEDWDFWLRVALAGGGFRHLDEVLFDYRVRADSLTKQLHREDDYTVGQRYLFAKPCPLTIGQYAELLNSWDAPVSKFRRRPLRSLARLILQTYFPSLYERVQRKLGAV